LVLGTCAAGGFGSLWLHVYQHRSTEAIAKPWFQGLPNEQGEWGDGRVDDDIFFWRQWKKAGNRLFVSPRVILGHGEYMVTWPGESLGKPVHQHATDFCTHMTPPEGVWRVEP